MIKLSKVSEPAVLANNAADWTLVLANKKASGSAPTKTEATRYRHAEVKAALVVETSGKCAYCESKLQHIHHGDVEHIYPKSLDLSLTFTWKNLTLACEICNQNKSNLDPYLEHIIDPYTVDPRDHLKFFGPLTAALGTVLGISTKQILDLNRPELIEVRQERLSYILKIFEQVLSEDLPLSARKAIYKDLISNEASPSKAYSAMTLDAIATISSQIPVEVSNIS